MEVALDRFRLVSKKASVVMFYFAGHGGEIEGKNYLLPTDVNALESSSGIAKAAFSLEEVLERLGQCGLSSRVLVLDCCRNNPFGSEPGGLARIRTSSLPPDTVVMYSGAPGETVSDGGVGDHSPFAKRLIENLVPGKSALTIFSTVATTINAGQKLWIEFDGEGSKIARLVLNPLMGQSLPEDVNLRLLANTINSFRADDARELERQGLNRGYLGWSIDRQKELIKDIAKAYYPESYFGSLGVDAYLDQEMKTAPKLRTDALKEAGDKIPEYLAYEAAEAKGFELFEIWNEMARGVASQALDANALSEWLISNGIESGR